MLAAGMALLAALLVGLLIAGVGVTTERAASAQEVAVQKVNTESQPVTLPAGTRESPGFGTATAECEEGRTVVGGGGATQVGRGAILSSSFPGNRDDRTANSWTVEYFNVGPQTDIVIAAYAHCILGQ